MDLVQRILPFIRDLNPRIDDLPEIVRLARKHAGDRAALARAIHKSWTRVGTRRGFSEHSILANTISSLGSENLGILTDSGELTELGNRLYGLRNKQDEFRDALTRHVLLRRGGWQFARALQTFGQQGRAPTRQEVAEYLAQKYGIDEWRDLNNVSSLHSLLMWGRVVRGYRVVEPEFQRLAGTTIADVRTLEGFSQETRDCLEALVRLGGVAATGDIRAAAEAQRGRLLDVHQMQSILRPLIDSGIVEFAGRRGDRQSLYAVTDSHKADVLAEVACELSLSGVVPDAVFQNTFSWIVERLKDNTLGNDERARTLEILAAKICWRLGLRHIHIRHRSEFEVDVLGDRVGMGYQRWVVQCKAYGNARIRSEHILREFGIAALTGYDVVLFVTTSGFSDDALRTISRIIQKTNVLVLPIGGPDLDSFAENETRLYDFVQSRSADARRLRLGATPADVLRELDTMRNSVLAEKPKALEVWARLQRRDVFVDFEVFAPMFVAWLESQHGTKGFDEEYLSKARAY